jgi:hypothetical protein
MIKTALGAKRYNNRMDMIFNEYTQEQAFVAEAIANHTTYEEVVTFLTSHGYSTQTAQYYAAKKLA